MTITLAAERLAELGDVRLQDLRRRGRRATRPEILDQPVARDRLTRVQKQDREQRTRLRRVQRDDAAVGDGFERPEYAEVHGGSGRTYHRHRASDQELAAPALHPRSTSPGAVGAERRVAAQVEPTQDREGSR